MAFFYKGNTYRVWERKGLAPNKKGFLAISENSFEKGEVTPDQELTYKGKTDGQHVCILPNGMEVVVHRNHFDVTTPYNVGKIQNRAKASGKGSAIKTDLPDERSEEAEALEQAEDMAQQIADELAEALRNHEAELEAELEEAAQG